MEQPHRVSRMALPTVCLAWCCPQHSFSPHHLTPPPTPDPPQLHVACTVWDSAPAALTPNSGARAVTEDIRSPAGRWVARCLAWLALRLLGPLPH